MATTLPDAILLAANLSDAEQVLRLFDKAVTQAGDIDILVNNAGIYQGKPFENYTLDELDRLMKVNVYAVFQLTQLAVTHMKARGSGKNHQHLIDSRQVGESKPGRLQYDQTCCRWHE